MVVWDVEARREAAKLPAPKGRGHPLAFTPDGKRLLVGSCPGANVPCRVVAYDVASGKDVWTWTGPAATLVYPAVSTDGKRVAVLTQGQGSRLAVLDAATGRETFHKELSVHVEPAFVESKWIAVADQTAGVVRLFDAASGEPVREWTASNSGLTALAAGPGGRPATADGRATIKVWNAATGQELMTLEGHAGVVLQLRELTVRTRVIELFETALTRAEVRRQLTADSTVTASDLAVIDRALTELPEDPRKLRAASWEVVRRPTRTS